MKIIYTKYFPPKGFKAINVFGFIFARKEYKPLSDFEVNHEAIHTAQMKEMFYLFFYVWYGLEWFVRLIQYRSAYKAYENISFERETYANQFDLRYLKGRKRYSWVGYLMRV